MKDRRRRDVVVEEAGGTGVGIGGGGEGGGGGRGKFLPSSARSSASSLRRAFLSCLCSVFIAAVVFSAFRVFGVSFHPVLINNSWQAPAINAVAATEHPFHLSTLPATTAPFCIQEAISLPDQVLLFFKFPTSLPNSDHLLCLYYPPSMTSSSSSSSSLANPELRLSPIASPSTHHPSFVRCPLLSRNFSISVSTELTPLRPRPWNHLTYAALLDTLDNSTIVFAKGLNLRPGRVSDASHFECVFGWNLSNLNNLVHSPAVSAAQEILRCETPPSILSRHLGPSNQYQYQYLPLVSVKTKSFGVITFPSVARPESLPHLRSRSRRRRRRRRRKENTMCVCTMVRNQAPVLREWITYHSRIGVERWFIYDNNSNDDIERVIASLNLDMNYNVTHHSWPWVKTQEAGFAHCALRSRDQCEWVGFIDVDEFFHLPKSVTLKEVLRNYSSKPSVGELRTACYNFGPSGLRTVPSEGVTVGYTCRMRAPERHKSIIRPEALHPSLMNVVHHFLLKDGIEFADIEKGVMVINHYKYQVWEVFKEKFYRRVATYVADWQDEENVGSKDRAPGLGTKPVEPPDWSSRFCQVEDTALREWVLANFVDPETGLLPW